MNKPNPYTPQKLTLMGIAMLIGLSFTLFALHKSGVSSNILIFAGVGTIIIAIPAVLFGMKMGRANYEKTAVLREKNPKTLGRIVTWGAIALLFGNLSMKKSLLFGALYMIAGGGLIFKKEWGRKLGIALSAIYVMFSPFNPMLWDISHELQARGLPQKYEIYLVAFLAAFFFWSCWGIYFLMKPETKATLIAAETGSEAIDTNGKNHAWKVFLAIVAVWIIGLGVQRAFSNMIPKLISKTKDRLATVQLIDATEQDRIHLQNDLDVLSETRIGLNKDKYSGTVIKWDNWMDLLLQDGRLTRQEVADWRQSFDKNPPLTRQELQAKIDTYRNHG